MDIAFRRVFASGEDSYGAAAGQAASGIGIRIGAVFLLERAGAKTDMDAALSSSIPHTHDILAQIFSSFKEFQRLQCFVVPCLGCTNDTAGAFCCIDTRALDTDGQAGLGFFMGLFFSGFIYGTVVKNKIIFNL